jgi:hypothetical protein
MTKNFASTTWQQFQNTVRYIKQWYDSECSDHFTFDKNRFIDEIRSACEWVKTSEDFMLIKEYDTMLDNAKLNERNRRLLFEDTTYISFIDVTLMFSTKLIKQKFDKCFRINTLMKMTSKKNNLRHSDAIQFIDSWICREE